MMADESTVRGEGPLSGLELRSIPPDRYDDVIQHLRANFFADEPLNRAVALCRPGEGHAELEAHSLTTLRDGYSVMAVETSTARVAGVALNGVTRPGDVAAAREQLSQLSDAKFRRIFDLLYGANLQLDLFAEHGVDRVFECRILSVDNGWRGRGLAKALLARSEAVARAAGFKVFKEDATGLFSQRVAESVGLKCVRQVRYSEYVAVDTGEVVFKPPEPHDTLKIMVKVL